MPQRVDRRAAVVGGAVGGITAVSVLCIVPYFLAPKRANEKRHEREVSELPPTYKDGEPESRGGSTPRGASTSL